MQAFDRAIGVDMIRQLVQRPQRGRCIRMRRFQRAARRHFGVDHRGDQHCVMRGQRAPRFRDQVRLRLAGAFADFGQRADDVAGVLAYRVVHRAVAAAARAFVVDAEAAADIDGIDRCAELAQFHVVARRLAHAAGDVLHVGDLRAQVEVNHADRIEPAGGAHHFDRLHHLRHGQAELRFLAAGVLLRRFRHGRQAHAQTDDRRHVQRLRFGQHQRQFRQLLDHDVDRVAKLGADQRAADVAAILVAIADDDAAGRRQAEHGRQFRLRASFKAHAVGAMRDDRLDHRFLLVDLDRVDRRVAAGVLQLLDHLREGTGQHIDAVLQDVGEAHQHGQVQPFQRQSFGQLKQVDRDRRIRALRTHDDVAFGIDVEVAIAPLGHVVQIDRVARRPAGFGHAVTQG